MGKTITICDQVIAAGEKFQSMITVPGTQYPMPVTIINGVKSGKTLYVSAGIHGGEYPGVAAVAEMAQKLQPEQINGAIILMHCVNYSGMLSMADTVVPEDGVNLNRIFPGDPNGSISHQIAAWLCGEILPQADFVLDLHSGSAYETLTPCLFFQTGCGEEMRRKSLAAAAVVDIPYCIASIAITEQYAWAVTQGIPGLLLERGCDGECLPEQVQGFCNDVHNVMVHLGMLKEQMFPRKTARQIFENTTYLETETSGLWYPAVKAGQSIEKGQLLGEVQDIFGTVLEQHYAQHDGIVFYHASSLVVKGGFSTLAAYGKIGE